MEHLKHLPIVECTLYKTTYQYQDCLIVDKRSPHKGVDEELNNHFMLIQLAHQLFDYLPSEIHVVQTEKGSQLNVYPKYPLSLTSYNQTFVKQLDNIHSNNNQLYATMSGTQEKQLNNYNALNVLEQFVLIQMDDVASMQSCYQHNNDLIKQYYDNKEVIHHLFNDNHLLSTEIAEVLLIPEKLEAMKALLTAERISVKENRKRLRDAYLETSYFYQHFKDGKHYLKTFGETSDTTSEWLVPMWLNHQCDPSDRNDIPSLWSAYMKYPDKMTSFLNEGENPSVFQYNEFPDPCMLIQHTYGGFSTENKVDYDDQYYYIRRHNITLKLNKKTAIKDIDLYNDKDFELLGELLNLNPIYMTEIELKSIHPTLSPMIQMYRDRELLLNTSIKDKSTILDAIGPTEEFMDEVVSNFVKGLKDIDYLNDFINHSL